MQVVDSQQDTQAVDEDPDDIEDIVSVGPLTVTHIILIHHYTLTLTWTRGQDGSSITAPAFAARAPLRKVGPRLTVTLANLEEISHISSPTKSPVIPLTRS